MKRSRTTLLITAATLTAVIAAPAAAQAAPAPSDPIVQGLAGPLQFEVSPNGIYVGQSFAGILTKVRPNGTTSNLFASPGNSITGVATRGYDVAFTWRSNDEANPASALKRRFANGTVRTVANLYAFEKRHNPDARNEYGFRNLSAACAAQVPPEIGGQPYTGLVDSNPYAIANAPDGGWYVADAGANAILEVSKTGRVSVVHVLRPQKVTITADVAASLGLPACTVGKVYAFEPVPTDVEVAANGMLFVSLLPGGPEDASLGARGSVVRIDPGDGEWAPLGTGFLGATNLALAPGGRIYVTELFANRISLLRNRVITPYLDVPSPAGLEYVNGMLYASVDVFGNGSIVTVRP
jgi:hypothetical protein